MFSCCRANPKATKKDKDKDKHSDDETNEQETNPTNEPETAKETETETKPNGNVSTPATATEPVSVPVPILLNEPEQKEDRNSSDDVVIEPQTGIHNMSISLVLYDHNYYKTLLLADKALHLDQVSEAGPQPHSTVPVSDQNLRFLHHLLDLNFKTNSNCYRLWQHLLPNL